MKSKQALIRCIFLATSTLSAPAFAGDASATWVEYRLARGLPVEATPSSPYVSPIPILSQMAVTDGDTNLDVIRQRFNAMYLATGAHNGNGNGNGNGHGNTAKPSSCDKQTIELFEKLAQSEGYRPGDNVGCPQN